MPYQIPTFQICQPTSKWAVSWRKFDNLEGDRDSGSEGNDKWSSDNEIIIHFWSKNNGSAVMISTLQEYGIQDNKNFHG